MTFLGYIEIITFGSVRTVFNIVWLLWFAFLERSAFASLLGLATTTAVAPS